MKLSELIGSEFAQLDDGMEELNELEEVNTNYAWENINKIKTRLTTNHHHINYRSTYSTLCRCNNAGISILESIRCLGRFSRSTARIINSFIMNPKICCFDHCFHYALLGSLSRLFLVSR